jgi:hypothetical protein
MPPRIAVVALSLADLVKVALSEPVASQLVEVPIDLGANSTGRETMPPPVPRADGGRGRARRAPGLRKLGGGPGAAVDRCGGRDAAGRCWSRLRSASRSPGVELVEVALRVA